MSQVVKLFEDPDFDNGSESRKKELRDRVSELMNQVSRCRGNSEKRVGFHTDTSLLPTNRCKRAVLLLPRWWEICLPSWRTFLVSAAREGVDSQETRNVLSCRAGVTSAKLLTIHA